MTAAVAKRMDTEEEQEAAKRELEARILAEASEGRTSAAFEDMEDDAPDIQAATDDKPLPDWAAIPQGVKTPDGWLVWFVKFRAKVTNTPGKGDRTCVLWNLSESDEKHAAKRARGDPMRVVDEMAKQMIRVVDGHGADWGGSRGAGSVDAFWQDIGGKCRHQLKSLYLKNHTMTGEETADFFEHCVAVRTAG
jgi:hypothetical protein